MKENKGHAELDVEYLEDGEAQARGVSLWFRFPRIDATCPCCKLDDYLCNIGVAAFAPHHRKAY
jgi:hypothetical protein